MVWHTVCRGIHNHCCGRGDGDDHLGGGSGGTGSDMVVAVVVVLVMSNDIAYARIPRQLQYMMLRSAMLVVRRRRGTDAL